MTADVLALVAVAALALFPALCVIADDVHAIVTARRRNVARQRAQRNIR